MSSERAKPWLEEELPAKEIPPETRRKIAEIVSKIRHAERSRALASDQGERRGFYEHLAEVPNPHPEGRTQGTLEEFNHHTHLMTAEALLRTGAEMVEYDVRELPKAAEEGERR